MALAKASSDTIVITPVLPRATAWPAATPFARQGETGIEAFDQVSADAREADVGIVNDERIADGDIDGASGAG